MITIGQPYVTRNNGKARLNVRVEVSDDSASQYIRLTESLKNCGWLTGTDYPPKAWRQGGDVLFFETDEKYADAFCTASSNAFVTAMFWYACVVGSDIRFEAPMSQRLFKGLTEILLPKLIPAEKDRIHLDGPLTNEVLSGRDGVVTGMSCGVDSFYTLDCYEKPNAPEGKMLTHLAYCEASYYLPRTEGKTDVDAIYRQHREYADNIRARAEQVAAKRGLSFIPLYTNLDENYYRGGNIYTAMYRFLACIMSLESLYAIYISSSSGHESGVLEVSLFVPTQHYEDLLIEACQTEGLQYITSDHNSRTEKLKVIADDPDFQKNADVCFNSGNDARNCGECYGCWKTMIPLDIIGKLSRFDQSFDLKKYYSNRKQIFQYFFEFSKRPEMSSARQSIRQIIKLAGEEDTEAGREFLETAKQYDSSI